MMNRLTLITVALFAATAFADTDVYTWVDETGQVHYSDTWTEGCKKVDVSQSSAPTRPYIPKVTGTEQDVETAELASAAPEEPLYKSITVVSPEEDDCLRRLGGIVKVLIDIDPAPEKNKLLQEPGHRLRVSLDGQPLQSEFLIGLQDRALVLFLTDVYRGTHKLQVTIEDKDAKQLAKSRMILFHVQEYSPLVRQQQEEFLRQQQRQE
mgnify:CR=1 FL=1